MTFSKILIMWEVAPNMIIKIIFSEKESDVKIKKMKENIYEFTVSDKNSWFWTGKTIKVKIDEN